jgi:hypothetical protein
MTEKQFDRFDLEDESSLLNWYPKIKGKVPTPATKVLELTKEEHRSLYGLLDGNPLAQKLADKITKMAQGMDEPFFLRSDQASGKHEWKDTCFVSDKSKIINHLAALVEWHACADMMGVRFTSLVFREYLPLQSQFTAFNGMPVAPEWRYFVRDGKPICKHFYWVKDAIWKPSRKDWETLHQDMQILLGVDLQILNNYATIFAENNPGYWSVDFALTRDRGWVLIDAARGEVSWHPAECMFNPQHDELMKEKEKPAPNFEGMLVEIDRGDKRMKPEANND